MWRNSQPEKDGFYWFKGEIRGYHDSWEKIDEVIVKIIDAKVYYPDFDASVHFSETRGLWKDVNENAYVKTKEALGIAESLLRVAFDKFEEVTGFVITNIEMITQATGNRIDKSMIVDISFGKGNIYINKKEK